MKIKNKIFLNFFLVSGFSLAIIFGAVYYFGRQIMLANIGGYNYLMAQNDIDSVDRFIDRRLEQWEIYARTNVDLMEELKKSNSEFTVLQDREEFIKTQDNAWQNSDATSTTPFINNILENKISNELRDRTAFYQKQFGRNVFPEVFITNQYGVLIASTNKTSDYLQADEDWWQAARTQGVWVSDIALDISSGINGLDFCISINDKKGNFIGVIKIVYNINDVFNIVDNLIKLETKDVDINTFGLTRETVIVNLLTKDGKLIYSTKDGFVGLKKSDELSSIQGNSFYIKTDEGVEELYSHAHSRGYSDFKGLGWFLVVEKQTQEVLAPLTKMINWLIIITLSVFGLVVILALWLTYSLNKPIKKLIEDVEQIQAGDLDHKINILGKDEIGQLAKTLANMVVAVKRSRAEVDKKVAEQTTEIKQKAADLADQQAAIFNILEDVEIERDVAAKERDKVDIILHSIGDGVFVVDKNERLLIFNQVAENISGFKVEEALGKKYGDILKFVFEKDGKINDEFVKKSMATGEIKTMANHTMLIRKDGTKVSVADSASPVKDKNGQVIGCVVVFRDVTKEREIDTMKSEFVSVASHQLRTPLTGIKWFAELLLKTKLSAKTKDYVKQIAISNDRMVHLVDDLLNVSRMETGRKFDIVLKDTDLVALSKDVILEQTPTAAERHITISCAADSPKKLVLAVDELKMRQVFQNLISNSIKYSKEKTNIILGCQQKKDEIIFYVKDQGIGIPKHQRDKVYEKFFRAENAFTMHTDGTGLGLYIVKVIVEAHHGKIWFESEENKGTTFYFSLPVKIAKPA